MNVYAIFNESSPIGSDLVITEVVQPLRFTYEEALADLQQIAEDNDVYVEDDASSVYVPVMGTHLESDEYYIVEMEVSNRG
jgi:hypothetical protein